jgi:protoporphyrinogen oxidase/uncharacterized membrane protein YbhN (UPF0104 family)
VANGVVVCPVRSPASKAEWTAPKKAPPIPVSWRRTLLRLGVSGLTLAVLLLLLPREQLQAALSRLPVAAWLAAVAVYLSLHLIGVVKWRLAVNLCGAGLGFIQAARCYYGGLFGNLFLPSIVGGDVVRAGLAFNRTRSRTGLVVGSVLDRLIDFTALAGLAGVAAVLLHDRLAMLGRVVLVPLAGLFGLGLVTLAAGWFLVPARRLPLRVRRLLVKLRQAIRPVVSRPQFVVVFLVLGGTLQSCLVLLNAWLGQSCGLDCSLAVWFFVWPMAKLSAALPVTQGGVGVREAALAGLFVTFGVPAALAVATGLVFQAVIITAALISGPLALALGRLQPPEQSSAEFEEGSLDMPVIHAEPVSARPRPAPATGVLPHVVILGAGPAGVGAAYRLRRRDQARVTVLEARDTVGGNAGSFDLAGVHCDFGSHRLHPVVGPDILSDLRELLGEDLMLRVRHGRILLRGRWIHFPLKPLDLLLRLPKGFALGVARDLCGKLVRRSPVGEETFASVLQSGLGGTMSREFYFPYARKLWGLPPEDLAVTTAKRRVSGSSVGKILRKVAGQIPGFRKPLAGRFYYPRRGYGQISQCLYEAARKHGATFLFGARVRGVQRTGQRVTAVRFVRDGEEHVLAADTIWSTVPVTMLARGMEPQAPADVLEAATEMRFRGMILIYLVLRADQFSPVDAYYFPEASVPISRLSEPKNFTGATEPRGRTVLCAELPTDPGEPEWDLDDAELGRRLCGWLAGAGLPVRVPVEKVVV